MTRELACLLLACLAPFAAAQEAAAGIEQKPGSMLPLSLRFNEADGGNRALGEFIGSHPAVLMFGYYHCRNLCDTSLDALARAVETAGIMPGRDAEVLFLGIDPHETPAEAMAKQRAYARAFAPAQPQRWHFLSGDAQSIATLAEAAGFRYLRDVRSGEYIHAAGLVLVAPNGAISSYLPGVAIDPQALRIAVAGAARGRIGAVVERVRVLCSRLGMDGSARSATFLRLVQALSLALLCGLALLLWSWRPRERGGV